MPLQVATTSLKHKLLEADRCIPNADAKKQKVFEEQIKIQQEIAKIEGEKTKLDKLKAGLEEEKNRPSKEQGKLAEDVKVAANVVAGWAKIRDRTVSSRKDMAIDLLTCI